jgi:hypothetical protein
MVQGREYLRLAFEPGEPIGVTRHRRQQHLDGDVSLQSRIVGPVHLSHAARPQPGDDFVGADASS